MFSKRLIEIASLIPSHSSVIDVGCDHGLLDIYLTINKSCKCTASDINENCLDKAKTNIKKFKLEKEIELKKSVGLKEIDYKPSYYIVIAGMGTNTILDILDNCHANNIVIQTNTELFDFRETITENYIIMDEKVVCERGIYYVIMKLKRGIKKYNYSDYLIGPIIKNKNTGIYKEYKQYLLDKYIKIYESIPSLKLNKRLEIRSLVNIIKKYC